MTKITLSFWVLLCPLPSIFAQPIIQWQRTLGGTLYEKANSIVQTTDNGFITTGYVDSEDGDVVGHHGITDYWVVKFDSTGLVQWKKCYGGSEVDWSYSVAQTSDQGYIVAGYTESNDGDVSGNHGDKDMWIVKLDPNGGVQWQKTLGGSGWEEAWSVKQAADGGYIIAGRTSSTDGDVTGFHGYFDYWIVKLSPNGDLEWQRALGGSGSDIGYSISPTTEGGYIVTGEANSQDGNVSGNHGNADYWVVKLNFEGKIEWEKSLGGTYLDRGNDVQQTRDGGYIAFGQARSNDGDVTGNHGGFDCWIVKLTEIGEIEWQKTLGGSSEDYGQSVIQVANGGYILTGTIHSTNGDITNNHGLSDLWIVKLSETGDLLWQKALGGSLQDRGFSVKQTTDQGFILAGDTWSNNGDVTTPAQGKTDFWIIKLNPETSPTTQATTLPLSLYPNPAQNTLQIQIPTPASSANLTLSNTLGQILLNQNLSLDSFGKAQLDLSALPNGFYLLSATLPDGQVFSGKMHKLE